MTRAANALRDSGGLRPAEASKGSALEWFVYIVECRNGSLYVGQTGNLIKRFSRYRAPNPRKCR